VTPGSGGEWLETEKGRGLRNVLWCWGYTPESKRRGGKQASPHRESAMGKKSCPRVISKNVQAFGDKIQRPGLPKRSVGKNQSQKGLNNGHVFITEEKELQ